MRKNLLNLGFAQLHNLCKSAESSKSSDPRKQLFKERLCELSKAFTNIDAISLDDANFQIHYKNHKFFFDFATALDPHNGYTLSKEMRQTLDDLLKCWIDNPEHYIISVTDGNFAINSYYDDWFSLNKFIETLYGVTFDHILLTIYVPKHLHDDFFHASVLYHEIGHFVDAYHNVYIDVIEYLKIIMADPNENKRIIDNYFPYINSNESIDERGQNEIIKNHCREMVADVFGAQYVGEYILSHIEYNRYGTYEISSSTHPSPQIRKLIISDFLNGKSNDIIELITKCFARKGLSIEKRYIGFDMDNLQKGEPINLTNSIELHSIIYNLWTTYLSGKEQIIKHRGEIISNHQFYNLLNNAVKTSIHNYFNR